ncbi:gibberellin 3-beta-dioxygenase 1-like [Cornus florida]|uniref:gibberellin 3-beta-dioxygenase 1-like n=1 Tax=Cornus florida TaxID=4283 RepID=UPI00289CEA0D|nr:gibberellin 3-beta-dioxygenase 1-like [Cornus florida]
MSTTLSKAYGENPLQLHHIIPLDFHTVHAVPDSHIWPQSDDDFSSGVTPNEESSIPIVDLMDPNVVELLGHACETWGVFQVTNHGIPLSLIEHVESEARRFFSLPAHQKEKVLRSPEGATGYGVARISPFFSKFMWHEGFTIMGSSAHDHASQLWPHDYTHFCDVMDEYQKKVKALAYNLFLLILESLDISKEEMDRATSVGESAGALQLNSYPPCPDPDCALGLAPHTDTLLLTVLHQSDTDGLQIFREGSGWVTVSPVAGALVVNVGDLLHIFSNARFHNVYHRAAVNRSRHRISVAYFYAPPPDSLVTPFSKLEFPRYRSLTVKEYVRIKAMHLEKALSLIRI